VISGGFRPPEVNELENQLRSQIWGSLMNTTDDTTHSGVLTYQLSWSDKLSLGVFGILDALLNCSLDSFNTILSHEFAAPKAKPAPPPPPPNAELSRLRAMRTQLDRAAAKSESVTTTVITRTIPLKERLKAKTRRQAMYSWRKSAE
jgi:hypothetical protein